MKLVVFNILPSPTHSSNPRRRVEVSRTGGDLIPPAALPAVQLREVIIDKISRFRKWFQSLLRYSQSCLTRYYLPLSWKSSFCDCRRTCQVSEKGSDRFSTPHPSNGMFEQGIIWRKKYYYSAKWEKVKLLFWQSRAPPSPQWPPCF